MKVKLQTWILLSEVREALWLIPNNKAPWSNGFSAECYKDFWEQLVQFFTSEIVSFIKESQSLLPTRT